MIVIADTSPFNYLVLIEHIEVLPELYTSVVIPPAVAEELQHPLAPKSVRDWIGKPRYWLEIRSPKNSLILPELDPGEVQAIALATEMNAQVLLMDEQAGRLEAIRRGLKGRYALRSG